MYREKQLLILTAPAVGERTSFWGGSTSIHWLEQMHVPCKFCCVLEINCRVWGIFYFTDRSSKGALVHVEDSWNSELSVCFNSKAGSC